MTFSTLSGSSGHSPRAPLLGGAEPPVSGRNSSFGSGSTAGREEPMNIRNYDLGQPACPRESGGNPAFAYGFQALDGGDQISVTVYRLLLSKRLSITKKSGRGGNLPWACNQRDVGATGSHHGLTRRCRRGTWSPAPDQPM